MKFKPYGDLILIKEIVEEKFTKSGIIIPGTLKDDIAKGLVVAIGDGTNDTKLVLKVGDIILYNRHICKEIIIEDETYLVMKETDILGTFKED